MAIIWVHGGIRKKEPADFQYKDEKFLHIISGKALEAYYAKRSEGVDLITFVPHSLYVGCMHEERKAMRKDLEEFYEFPLPSIGTIPHNDTKYSFNGNYQYVKFWIFLKLLEIYLEGRYGVFYCDISQGLNVYTHAFKEAFESLLLFDRLRNMGRDGIKVYMLYSDPIIHGVENPRLYDDVELKVKAWFDSPIGRPIEAFARKHLLETEIERVLENYYRTYRAIRYNAPGVVLTFGYDGKERIEEVTKKFLKTYTEKYDPGEFQKSKTEYNYPLPEEPEEKINIFLALALYYNMAVVFEEKEISQKREFTLEDLKRFFEVYQHYGLSVNKELLGRDIERLKDIESHKKLLVSSEWWLLGELINQSFSPRKAQELANDQSARRNFFAHSGMENNSVCVRKDEEGKLVFKYREEFYSIIDRFVYEEGA
ncbi:MAG: hypothetical protein N2648_06290 [Aquificaceae bacterium]|nr:hypothetical protein [Aquificaceae bacterium]